MLKLKKKDFSKYYYRGLKKGENDSSRIFLTCKIKDIYEVVREE